MQRSDKLLRRRLQLSVLALLLIVSAAPVWAADDLAVQVVNASEPTLCAEKDNIYLKLVSGEVRRFTIEAAHPAYIGTIVVDSAAPDFRHCDMSTDPAHQATPRRVTLFETAEWQLVGLVFPSFWRQSQVTVRVGNRVESGLHLLQLWTRFQERAEEVLVVYPADGYWRARPLPPPHLRWSAYGSSFLVGPIETADRPFVDIREIAFDPANKTFRLTFARGGNASLRLDALDQAHVALEVTLDPAIGGEQPFAGLRSMFVADGNADIAQIAWRGKGDQAWRQEPVMSLKQATAVELWAGRIVPSRHNLSAPDMIFRDFRAAP